MSINPIRIFKVKWKFWNVSAFIIDDIAQLIVSYDAVNGKMADAELNEEIIWEKWNLPDIISVPFRLIPIGGS